MIRRSGVAEVIARISGERVVGAASQKDKAGAETFYLIEETKLAAKHFIQGEHEVPNLQRPQSQRAAGEPTKAANGFKGTMNGVGCVAVGSTLHVSRHPKPRYRK